MNANISVYLLSISGVSLQWNILALQLLLYNTIVLIALGYQSDASLSNWQQKFVGVNRQATHICQHHHICDGIFVFLGVLSWVRNQEWFGISAYCLFNEAMTILLGGGRVVVLRLTWALLAVQAGARAVSRLPIAVPCSLRWQWWLYLYNGLLSSDQATCVYHAWRCQYPQILTSLW